MFCSGALGLLVLLVPIALGAGFNFLDATLALHLAMVVLLSGTVFVLDDPARSLIEVLPISARTTAALRMALALIPISIFWALILGLAPYTVASGAAYPRAGLIIELYALLAWSWAAGAVAAERWTAGAGGPVAAPFLLVLAVALALLPGRLAFFVAPGAPEYSASRTRWLVLLLTGLIALAAANASHILPRASGLRSRSH
ncbi:hypothetical protein BG844_07580 [Couchioplanes caeruleus subsp. caeruleus]|uniref:ABC-2 type transport system permease protein n=2 Tax=Couchioplanes caeruleus TaxID=56438 RepID=A0A1K0FQ02_9ACTN|nr:hypothetical protein BG844_07580 [Couchioplanes caeruleus subsp. caeruleus]